MPAPAAAICSRWRIIWSSIASTPSARQRAPSSRWISRCPIRRGCSVSPLPAAAYPACRAARVVIALRDGARFEHLQLTRKGDPEQPLSDAELDEKFFEPAGPVIGDATSRALQAMLRSGSELPGALPRL